MNKVCQDLRRKFFVLFTYIKQVLLGQFMSCLYPEHYNVTTF